MDPIQAIGSLNSSPVQGWQNHQEMMNLKMCEPGAAHKKFICESQVDGAHLTPYVEPLPQPPSDLNVNSLAIQFSDGMRNGFLVKGLEQMTEKIIASEKPGSTITPGQITAEILVMHARIGTADACAKMCTKLVEGLQSVVTKQG